MKAGRCVTVACGVLCLLVVAGARGRADDIEVDFARPGGEIRALHGVNLGPLCYRGTIDLSNYHRELAIPLTRLHDVVWLNAEAVDIHCVFPDFRNNPERADSYAFAATDDYLQAIVNVGSKIVYRLGESIEHTPHKYHVHPPADPDKWASVCLGIIRHYNEGWAAGAHHAIGYWEIWNEPDIGPAMWTGTEREYFNLYRTAASAIKARYPLLKVGGPAVGNVGHFEGDVFHPSSFATDFLGFCQQQAVPLDFFSWHRYTSRPWDLPRYARAVRALLDQYGFKDTESHLNEWNYLPDDDWRPMLSDGQGVPRQRWYEEMGGPDGAAFAACALMLLQDAPVTAANFYTGEIQGFGLFDFYGSPKRTFYAFKAFRALLDTPRRVEVRGAASSSTAALAGLSKDQSQAAVLLSAFRPAEPQFRISLRHWPWPGSTRYEALVVDESHSLSPLHRGKLETGDASLAFALKGSSVLLIKLNSEDSNPP
jgi:hypothetical protein